MGQPGSASAELRLRESKESEQRQRRLDINFMCSEMVSSLGFFSCDLNFGMKNKFFSTKTYMVVFGNMGNGQDLVARVNTPNHLKMTANG